MTYRWPKLRSLIRRMRGKYPVQMPELKATKLLRSGRGRALISDVLDAMHGRYIVTLYDKRLSLACKLFEYLYEPVLQANNALFYRHNLHRFVGDVLLHAHAGQSIRSSCPRIRSFHAVARSRGCPDLVRRCGRLKSDDSQILRFVRGYNVTIARETRDLGGSEAIIGFSTSLHRRSSAISLRGDNAIHCLKSYATSPGP